MRQDGGEGIRKVNSDLSKELTFPGRVHIIVLWFSTFIVDSLEKTLMLGRIGGRRKRG